MQKLSDALRYDVYVSIHCRMLSNCGRILAAFSMSIDMKKRLFDSTLEEGRCRDAMRSCSCQQQSSTRYIGMCIDCSSLGLLCGLLKTFGFIQVKFDCLSRCFLNGTDYINRVSDMKCSYDLISIFKSTRKSF